MRQCEQVFNMDSITVVYGRPVTIPHAPEGYSFLLVTYPNGLYGIFSIDTGMYINSAFRATDAKANAARFFEIHGQSQKMLEYLRAMKTLFNAYKYFLWACAEASAAHPFGKSTINGVPKFPFTTWKE